MELVAGVGLGVFFGGGGVAIVIACLAKIDRNDKAGLNSPTRYYTVGVAPILMAAFCLWALSSGG